MIPKTFLNIVHLLEATWQISIPVYLNFYNDQRQKDKIKGILAIFALSKDSFLILKTKAKLKQVVYQVYRRINRATTKLMSQPHASYASYMNPQ